MTRKNLPALPQSQPEPQPEAEPNPPETPAIFTPEELPPELAFTPVPRKRQRSNGLTPLKQATFIMHLVGCGNVEKAARAIGASSNALYQLRKAEGAESFSAAWEKAVDSGARRVLDTLMEHAIYGVPETIIKDGKVILERRKFNSRAMMWIVQQRFPEQYGGNLNLSGRPGSSLPHGLQKLKEEWRREWEEQHLRAASEEEAAEALLKKLTVLNKRIWHQQYVPWMDDPEKRAAADLLHGPQDWEEIRRRARRDELKGGMEPEEEARLGIKRG